MHTCATPVPTLWNLSAVQGKVTPSHRHHKLLGPTIGQSCGTQARSHQLYTIIHPPFPLTLYSVCSKGLFFYPPPGGVCGVGEPGAYSRQACPAPPVPASPPPVSLVPSTSVSRPSCALTCAAQHQPAWVPSQGCGSGKRTSTLMKGRGWCFSSGPKSTYQVSCGTKPDRPGSGSGLVALAPSVGVPPSQDRAGLPALGGTRRR